MRFNTSKLFIFLTILLISGISTASANMEQLKLYKGVHGQMPKCIQCHVDKAPKKDPGLHEFNEYGKKVTAIAAKPTAETYQAAGPAPEPA